MTPGHDDIAAKYRTGLVTYMHAPDETGRVHVYDLGHRVVETPIGSLQLAAIRRTALDAFVADDQTRDRLVASIEFLFEILSTFEMTQRGYREAQDWAALAHCDRNTVSRARQTPS